MERQLRQDEVGCCVGVGGANESGGIRARNGEEDVMEH